jgi:hypothetical protein
MSVCCDCFVRRADYSSTGVLLNVVCLSVIKESHSGGLDPLGLSSHEKEIVERTRLFKYITRVAEDPFGTYGNLHAHNNTS